MTAQMAAPESPEMPPELVQLLEGEEKQGNHIDIARFRIKQPEKVKYAAWLLGKDTPIRTVCKLANLSATTVCAIIRDPELGPSIAQQKAHVTSLAKAALRVGLESKVEQWTAEGAKSPDVFDLRMLHQMVTQDEGGATVRVEHFGNVTVTNLEADLYRMIDAKVQTVERPMLSNGEDEMGEVLGMGSHGQKVHALEAGAESAQAPDDIRESEDSLPIT